MTKRLTTFAHRSPAVTYSLPIPTKDNPLRCSQCARPVRYRPKSIGATLITFLAKRPSLVQCLRCLTTKQQELPSCPPKPIP